MGTAEGGSTPAAGHYLPPAPAPWTFNGGVPSDHFRFVQAPGALIYFRPSSPGEAAAPGMVEAVGTAWRRLAGPGTKTRGVEIFLSDPFADPSSGEVVTHGTVVDEQRRQIWMAVTDEARPESPERPLALILGTGLPDRQELGFLLEGFGLALSDMPDPDPRLRQTQLPALAEATGPLRDAMACSFVRFLLRAKDAATFARLLTTTPPGGLSAACEQLYDAPLAALEQRWRQQLFGGREEPDVVPIEREAGLRGELEAALGELEAERAARASAEQALQVIEKEWQGRQELSERQLAEARLELERAEQEGASEHQQRAAAEQQRAAAEQQLERLLESESQQRAELKAAREEMNERAEATRRIERALGEAHAELKAERSARAQAQESVEVAERERRAEQEQLERGLAEARRGLQRAREETASEREQRAEVEQQLAQLGEAERHLHAEMTEARRELEATGGQLEATRGQLEATRGELEATRRELEATRRELEATGGQLEATRGELQATRGDLAEAADEMEQARAQLRERAVAAGELERALDDTRQELGQVKQALVDAEERHTARSAELRDERASRLESDRELSRLGTRLDQVTAALTAAEAELAPANERVEEERRLRHELEQQMQASLQRLQGELKEARDAASAEAASAATSTQRLLTTRRELEREIHARVNAETNLKRSLSELRWRAARANEMLSHARAEAAHEQRRVEIVQRELDEVRTQLAHERGDRASLELNGDGRSSPGMAPESPLDSLEHDLAQADEAED